MKKIAAVVAMLFIAGSGWAQACPSRAVKVVVPWPPGQATDIVARVEAAGLPDYDTAGWIGYAAPQGTPREILVRISGEIQKALQSGELKERYLALGLDPVSGTPEEMAAFMRREQDRYAAIIRNANIKIEQ